MTLDHTGAREAAATAVDGGARHGDLVAQIAGDTVLCFLDLFANRLPQALDRARHITARAELPHAAEAHVFQPWFVACLVHLEADRLEQVAATARRGRQVALSRGSGWAVPGYDAVSAFGALRAGSLDDAAAAAEAHPQLSGRDRRARGRGLVPGLPRPDRPAPRRRRPGRGPPRDRGTVDDHGTCPARCRAGTPRPSRRVRAPGATGAGRCPADRVGDAAGHRCALAVAGDRGPAGAAGPDGGRHRARRRRRRPDDRGNPLVRDPDGPRGRGERDRLAGRRRRPRAGRGDPGSAEPATGAAGHDPERRGRPATRARPTHRGRPRGGRGRPPLVGHRRVRRRRAAAARSRVARPDRSGAGRPSASRRSPPPSGASPGSSPKASRTPRSPPRWGYPGARSSRTSVRPTASSTSPHGSRWPASRSRTTSAGPDRPDLRAQTGWQRRWRRRTWIATEPPGSAATKGTPWQGSPSADRCCTPTPRRPPGSRHHRRPRQPRRARPHPRRRGRRRRSVQRALAGVEGP